MTKTKTIDTVKKWVETVLSKGEVVEVIQTPTVLIIRKLAPTESFSYAYKTKKK